MSERVKLTTDAGAPIGDNQNAITAGTGGDLSGGAARNHFCSYLDGVRREGRYRTFVDLQRHAHPPPFSTLRRGDDAPEVVVWGSNDYLRMGRPRALLDSITPRT